MTHRDSATGIAAALLALLVVLTACGDAEPPAPAARAEPRQLDDVSAQTAPLDELRLALDAAERRAQRTVGSPEGVAEARRAASLARVLASRDSGSQALARARTLLAEASRRRLLPGACEASLELADVVRELEGDRAAYIELHRTTRRFRDPASATCIGSATVLLAELSGARPEAAVLAAIDADPDADDPSAGLATSTVTPGTDGTALGSSEALLRDWAARASAESAPAQLESVVVHGQSASAESVRLVLVLDRVTPFDRIDQPADAAFPRRAGVTLPRARLAEGIPDAIPIGAAGVVRARIAEDQGVRVTLDLDDDAGELSIFLLPDPYRLVIDVSRRAPVLATSVPQAERPVEIVLLDPGHGADDFGARAFGLREAELTLDLALRARAVLARRAPALRVVLTRTDDTFVSLEQRAAMANAVSADLFVSIHLNAADEPVDHGGVTTFVLDTTDDRQALRLAARENGTSTSEVTDLGLILAGLRRDDQVAGSRALAERIHRALLASGRTVLPTLHDRGVRSAMFHVLVGATMPAVLVEASFMTREDEARMLRTERYRQALAEGIAEGIARYAGGR